MAKIQVLSENMIHKIAAGEVIERPASVVKELVENALDAKAKRIHIEVKAGGRQEICVADDGGGMSREDAALSVARHSTSKMCSPSDLFAISTLGFRGEALASIGAVSRMSIETRVVEEAEGTRIVVEGGIHRELNSTARAVGTTVSVRNIFFNTPARRKFLRHIDTETRHITQSVVQLAAAHPQTGFELVHQDRTVLSLASGDRRERAGELLGSESESLLFEQMEEDGVAVEVFICPPAQCQRSKGKQFVIVRGRPIFARGMSQAVYRGYGGLLSANMHPSFMVWLEIDPRQIDVNVHPTKREVRFADERRIARVVEATVRQSLDMPETEGFTYRQEESGIRSSKIGESQSYISIPANLASRPSGSLPAEPPPADQMSLSFLAPSAPSAEGLFKGDESAKSMEVALEDLESAPAIWQVHNKYIIAPIKDGILIIDQHVAHERIRYEEALDNFQADGTSSQQLLFPLTATVNAVEMETIREAQELFGKLGFGVREFGPGTVLVESIPSAMKEWGEGEVFSKIISELLEEKEVRNSLQEAMAASYACHTSIRAGERLSADEMQVLVDRLLKAREPFVCPHGRPIIIKIPLNELDRMFGRI